MAYKSTGRAPGRPKTKEYTTLLARVPEELAELVKRYAAQHGQSISQLVREGVEWRVGDGDPRGTGLYLAQPAGMSENVYSSNTGMTSDIPGMARFYEAIAALTAEVEALRLQALETQSSRNTGNTQTAIEEDGTVAVATKQGRVKHARETEGTPGPTEPHDIPSYPPFDTSASYLGKLCPQGHDYYGTGQSLRRLKKQDCRECERLSKQARRQAVKTG